MFDLIIRHTEQTSEDTWSLRHSRITLEIPGLKEHLATYHKGSNPHVVDVQPVNSESKED